MKEAFFRILKRNQIKKGKFFFTLPSKERYPYQWFWDSCFHSIIYLRLKRPLLAKKEIYSLLQNQWKNGMIPHMSFWGENEINLNWESEKDTSSITQTPLIAYSVERIFKQTNDLKFIENVFPKLDSYYKWLDHCRSSKGLVNVFHPWETGEDDLISWDSVYGLKNNPSKSKLRKIKLDILRNYLKNPSRTNKKFSVKSVLFNSVYIRSLESMKFLSKELNSKKISIINFIKIPRFHSTIYTIKNKKFIVQNLKIDL